MSHLTTQQLGIIKAYILATPALSAIASGINTDYQAVASALNALASPDFYVWRTSISRTECQSEGFDWTQCDNLTTGQARIWEWLFDANTQSFNPSESGKRSGVSECWKGTAAKVAVATFVLGLCKRKARQVEKLLATGAGTSVSPATMSYEGELSAGDIGEVMSA